MQVHTLETNYTERNKFAACYLAQERDHFILIENNTTPAWALLEKQTASIGVNENNLDWHFITHIHLDHAGATGHVAQLFPNTPIGGHPRALKHAENPEKLIKSAQAVYGLEIYNKLFGQITAVVRDRLHNFTDGQTLSWQGQNIVCMHTEGHAKHHCAFWFQEASVMFTGDTFGICYPQLQKGELFIFPSTSPTDFDAEQAIKSVEKLAQTGAQTFYPTHFGKLTQISQAKNELIFFLEHSAALVEKFFSTEFQGPDLKNKLLDELTQFYGRHINGKSLMFNEQDWQLLSMDLELNAQGLAHRIWNLRNPR